MSQIFQNGKAVPVTPIRVNDETSTALFKVADVVMVSAISKGKGFQGVVKRHGFSGGPKSHGQKDRLRAPGAIGGGSRAGGRVRPGMRMAGRMGGVRATILNIAIVDIDPVAKTVLLKGSTPGNTGAKVEIYKNA